MASAAKTCPTKLWSTLIPRPVGGGGGEKIHAYPSGTLNVGWDGSIAYQEGKNTRTTATNTPSARMNVRMGLMAAKRQPLATRSASIASDRARRCWPLP